MRVHRMLADVELIGDVAAGLSRCQVAENINFPCGDGVEDLFLLIEGLEAEYF